LAEVLGLDAARSIGDMADESFDSIVVPDVAVAKRLGIERTPGIFLDGKKVTKLFQTPRLWPAVTDRYTQKHTRESQGRRAA